LPRLTGIAIQLALKDIVAHARFGIELRTPRGALRRIWQLIEKEIAERGLAGIGDTLLS
jgi:hypothetical protein